MTFLRNYHWKGYNVETIQSTPNMLTNLHRGKYPIHRLCHNVNIECRVFNLMEVCTWLNGEKWNILWAEDESLASGGDDSGDGGYTAPWIP